MPNFFDKLATKTSQRIITDEGYLLLPARIGRTGIQTYKAGELGLKDRDPMDIVNIYRSPEEVFNKDSLASFKLKPVTNGHPPSLVTLKNHKDYAVGTSHGDVTHDSTYVNSDLLITDEATIQEIGQGKVEVSNGYTADIEFTKGDVDGMPYEGIQKNIRGNHIAIVKRGRAGRNVRLSDDDNTTGTPLVKVTINDIAFEIPDGPAADAVSKLVKDKELADTALATANTEHAATLAAKDSEILQLKKDAKALADSAPDVEKLVEERVAFGSDVALIDSAYDAKGKAPAVAKRELLAAKKPELNIVDTTPDAYVDAAWDIMVNDAKSTASRNATVDTALGDAVKPATVLDAAGKPKDTRAPDVIARERMIAANREAHK